MAEIAWKSMIGLAGVAANERAAARRWARRFELPMIMIALWIPVQWYLDIRGVLTLKHDFILDWIIWLTFLTETVILTALVRDKVRYLKGNWVNLLIILGGLPIIWNVTPLTGVLRSMRLLILLGITLRFTRTLRQILALNRLGYTLLVSFVIIMISGIVISGIDPAIQTPWEGIWWAWVTVTTVGYGDLVPQSAPGKVFGGLLILMGIALFSLLTANFSAYFIGAEVKKVEHREKRLQKEVAELEQVEADIEKDVSIMEREEDEILLILHNMQNQLRRIEERLKRLEEEGRGEAAETGEQPGQDDN